MVKDDMASRKHRTTCTSGENPELPAGKLNPVEVLRQLHREGGGLTAAAAINYMEEIREDRRQWKTGSKVLITEIEYGTGTRHPAQ